MNLQGFAMTFWPRHTHILPLVLTLAMVSACGETPPSTAQAPQNKVTAPPKPEVAYFVNPVFPTANQGRFAASHILVSHADSIPGIKNATINRKQAFQRTQTLHQKISDGASFEAMAQTHSNDPSGKRGGRLGVFTAGTMVPLFEQAVASVAVNELAPIIETPFGFHIIRRDAINEARASHVLVSHKEAPKQTNSRSKEDAKARIWDAYNKVREGVPFREVSIAYSDDTTNQNQGDLGLVGEGQMVPEFDRALFRLSIGQVSEPFETAYGYHIVLRRK